MGHSSILRTNLDSEVGGILNILFYNVLQLDSVSYKKGGKREGQKDIFAFERRQRSNEMAVVSH